MTNHELAERARTIADTAPAESLELVLAMVTPPDVRAAADNTTGDDHE